MTLTALETESVATESPPAVSIRGLHKRYGAIEAVQGIDLVVPSDELFGFLGPNGAGKSTTIKVLCTLVAPTSGDVRVCGFDVVAEKSEVRRHIGLVFQEPTLDGYLSAEQNLRFHAAIYGMPKATIGPRIDAVLELVGLTDRRKSPVGTFSGGMKRRLEIARGLLHSPRVLFLDEPTIGLDPESRSTLWRYVDNLRRQEHITIFLTTHYMDEAEQCDRIAIMNHGQIVAEGSPNDLKAAIGRDRVLLRTSDDQAAAAAIHDALGVDAAVDTNGVVVLVKDGDAFVPRLFEIGLTVQSMSVERPSLDDVFMQHAGHSIGRDGDAAAVTHPR